MQPSKPASSLQIPENDQGLRVTLAESPLSENETASAADSKWVAV